jgi:hypothetical protein
MARDRGLDAVLVGNAHFAAEAQAGDGEPRVAAAHLKLIDARTLEILAHVVLDEGTGLRLDTAARALAREIAEIGQGPVPGLDPGDAAAGDEPDPRAARGGMLD